MAILSIVVPVYNGEKYLDRCVESLISQTLTDIELLLVDDGSTDGSAALCNAWAQRDPRVRVLHQKNGGPMAAVRTGVDAAQTEWIGFCDCDDWVVEEYYEVLYTAIVSSGADLVCCGHRMVYSETAGGCNADTACTVVESADVLRRFFSGDACLVTKNNRWSKLFRRNVLAECVGGIDPGLRIGEDCVLVLEYLQRCDRVCLMERFDGYFYRQLPTSLVHAFRAYLIEENENFFRHLERLAAKNEYDFTTREHIRDSLFANLLYVCASSSAGFKEKTKCSAQIVAKLHRPEAIVRDFLFGLNPMLKPGFRWLAKGWIVPGTFYVSLYCWLVSVLKREA